MTVFHIFLVWQSQQGDFSNMMEYRWWEFRQKLKMYTASIVLNCHHHSLFCSIWMFVAHIPFVVTICSSSFLQYPSCFSAAVVLLTLFRWPTIVFFYVAYASRATSKCQPHFYPQKKLIFIWVPCIPPSPVWFPLISTWFWSLKDGTLCLTLYSAASQTDR